MKQRISRRSLIAGTAAVGLLSVLRSARAQPSASTGLQDVLDYAKSQKTTGFLMVRNGQTLVEENWPAPRGEFLFNNLTFETTAEGALLEDVASQQKSFVSILVAVAIDKGLLDISKPVSAYVGPGWSKATPDREAKIRVTDIMTMSSGLKADFTFAAPAGTVFLYNTPVYAVTKQILAAAARQPLETLTRDWLTAPAAMTNTSWRKRPLIFASVGNPTGLVTSPRDTARLGHIVLNDGKALNGTRIVSKSQMHAIFHRSPTNPAYGRLWWLNGSKFTIKPPATRLEGPMILAAPTDLVAAMGALDRRLYVVPSKRLVVVRMGAGTPDKDFDQQLWRRLRGALG